MSFSFESSKLEEIRTRCSDAGIELARMLDELPRKVVCQSPAAKFVHIAHNGGYNDLSDDEFTALLNDAKAKADDYTNMFGSDAVYDYNLHERVRNLIYDMNIVCDELNMLRYVVNECLHDESCSTSESV